MTWQDDMPGMDTPSLRPSGEITPGMTDRLGGFSLYRVDPVISERLVPHAWSRRVFGSFFQCSRFPTLPPDSVLQTSNPHQAPLPRSGNATAPSLPCRQTRSLQTCAQGRGAV